MDNQFLGKIVELLNAGGWNYSVFLRLYETPVTGNANKEATIQALLGSEATLYEIEEVEASSVWPVIEACLLYEGDEGAGPAASALNSAKMSELMKTLEYEVRILSDKAITIDSFWLKEGHPAYPVFWDFAFLFSGAAGTSILIGSSSD